MNPKIQATPLKRSHFLCRRVVLQDGLNASYWGFLPINFQFLGFVSLGMKVIKGETG
jgi:hypothetical protein